MATATTRMMGSGRVRTAVLSGPPVHMRWGAIFGGVFAALGISALLYSLGLALGLTSLNPSDASSARSSGLFAAIWSAVVPLVGLFVGGWVAGRGAGVISKGGGAIHGLVMWGVTTVAGMYLIGSLVGSLLGGAVNLGASVAKGGAGLFGQLTSRSGTTFGLDANDALGPINQRLQAEGKPAITSEQLTRATKDAISDAVRTGSLSRESLVSAIARDTALSRQDSEDIANRIQAQWDGAKAKVQTGALKAAEASGKAFWGVFAALLLGGICAVLGGMAGVSRRQDFEAKAVTATPPLRTYVAPTEYPKPPQPPLQH